ncbi:MAG: hypothetical protein ABR529_11575 [Actinomycetota bacterium]
MASIEYLVVANHAEVHNGHLFISGAGWTDLIRGLRPDGPPSITHMGIALSIIVPFTETGRRHHFTIRIEREDGPEITRVEGDLEMGRPVGLPAGADQRAVLAVNADITFPEPGGYRVVAFLGDGDHPKTSSFRVHDQPMQAQLAAG